MAPLFFRMLGPLMLALMLALVAVPPALHLAEIIANQHASYARLLTN